jgi:hypothetical protein
MRTLSLIGRRSLAGVIAVVGLLVAGCTGDADDRDREEVLDESDEALSLRPIENMKEQIRGWLQNYSAVQRSTKVEKKDALKTIRDQVQSAGMNPDRAIYVLQPKKLPLLKGIPFDHTEVDIVGVHDGYTTTINGRLIGDFWGAGLYNDSGLSAEQDLGPPLCVTYNQLKKAVEVSYVPGGYATNYVCHNITFRVIDSLDVSVKDYSAATRGWKLSSYAYFPIWARTPTASISTSAAARKCVELGIE